MSGSFVDEIVALASYADRTICHTSITGGGHRFHGFLTFKFRDAARVLKEHQRNLTFNHAKTCLEVESRLMTDRSTVCGVVAPDSLSQPPYSLRPLPGNVHAGAVSRVSYAWSSVITDTLLHGLTQHPTCLDVWVEKSKISVFCMHDRNIIGGLSHHIAQCGIPVRRTRLAGKLSRSAASSAWKPFSQKSSKHKAGCGSSSSRLSTMRMPPSSTKNSLF